MGEARGANRLAAILAGAAGHAPMLTERAGSLVGGPVRGKEGRGGGGLSRGDLLQQSDENVAVLHDSGTLDTCGAACYHHSDVGDDAHARARPVTIRREGRGVNAASSGVAPVSVRAFPDGRPGGGISPPARPRPSDNHAVLSRRILWCFRRARSGAPCAAGFAWSFVFIIAYPWSASCLMTGPRAFAGERPRCAPCG